MAKLEELTVGAQVRGLQADQIVTIVRVQWHGSETLEVSYRDSTGREVPIILYRDREPDLEVVAKKLAFSFDADPALFRLTVEARRIQLAHLFDPILAVHTSKVDPLPHQIAAVYHEMLRRQPLRFLLADDPGAGKTIMAGLFMKELIARGDLHRCLIVCPGMLAEQWQDELDQKFQLPFEILSNEKLESARTGNWFQENALCICRLDKLSRNEDVQAKLLQTDWDLIVVDEAHKMSAQRFNDEVKETKRYKLGKLLGGICRNLLLMTATPHNGKDEDFQLFMALLDSDRFEGRVRDGTRTVDVSDLMRRLVKEKLLKFDGTALFPPRKAYTPSYKLSAAEANLYKLVTDYVTQEFNRADNLDEGRRGTVGFALTTLQRRLASSPEAIYQSLLRRRERLETRARELRLSRLVEVPGPAASGIPVLSEEAMTDLDEAPDSEVEEVEEQVLDQATAARTLVELETEIATLKTLETLAKKVRNSDTDKKWDELSKILNDEKMFDANGHRRKLVIFTEHRDTLRYLTEKVSGMLGKPESIVTIDGQTGRDERRKRQELFTQDKDTQVLIATDAAGEGINLQRSHLMINYDLPWNPNRLEQRFGRIHRIGQAEVCHLWNLVAEETREGEVFIRLLKKLEAEREALGRDSVFDILGQVFQGKPLRDLLIEAIRFGEEHARKQDVFRQVDESLDRNRLRDLLDQHALTRDTMDVSKVQQIREEMEKAAARRLQPNFIESFFIKAFEHLGGTAKEREPRRYEIAHVPAVVRNRDRQIGRGAPVLTKYERITFEKDQVAVPKKALAAFVCPGHALLDSCTDLVLEKHRGALRQGAILVDDRDDSADVRVLIMLEHAIQDARITRTGAQQEASRRMLFVEVRENGDIAEAGFAPHLDYRPPTNDECSLLGPTLTSSWLGESLEQRASSFANTQLVRKHFDDVKRRRESLVDKTLATVKDRLTKEINYWDHRAQQLELQEKAGKQPRLNSSKAKQRADDLQGRLQKRIEELKQERMVQPAPPIVVGGALVVPIGLIRKLSGTGEPITPAEAAARKEIERIAMEAVIAAERNLGHQPFDVAHEKCGYDVWSRPKGSAPLRFIEVKGRKAGAKAITVTRNEIVTAVNESDKFILAIVEVDSGKALSVKYVRRPFKREPDFAVTSQNYNIVELLTMGEDPS